MILRESLFFFTPDVFDKASSGDTEKAHHTDIIHHTYKIKLNYFINKLSVLLSNLFNHSMALCKD